MIQIFLAYEIQIMQFEFWGIIILLSTKMNVNIQSFICVMDAPVILTSLCNETPVHLNMETKTKIQLLYGERRARKNKMEKN